MKLLLPSLVAPTLAVGGLQAWRSIDERRATSAWRNLRQKACMEACVFDLTMIDGLPQPARRFFQFTIQPGTPLRNVVELRMTGSIGLGTKLEPKYLPMRARQILAPPYGFVWRLAANRGAMRISGSDGLTPENSWTRFWLVKTLPIVRAGANTDHALAAFGRVVAESVFWAPATLLPHNGVKWEEISADTARATVEFDGLTQTVDVTVGEAGQPLRVVIPRWSNANPEKVYRLQPFGGTLADYRDFDGYRLPTRVEGGNFFGTDAYFPFYKVVLENVKFVTAT